MGLAERIDAPAERASRTTIQNWPRLLSEHLAAAYLSVSQTTLRGLEIHKKRIGRRVLYDLRDLDRYADRLDEQPFPEDAAAHAAAVADQERRFFAKRRARGQA